MSVGPFSVLQQGEETMFREGDEVRSASGAHVGEVTHVNTSWVYPIRVLWDNGYIGYFTMSGQDQHEHNFNQDCEPAIVLL